MNTALRNRWVREAKSSQGVDTNILSPRPVSVERFVWLPESRLFVTEASDLAPQPFGQVYRDAADVGLTLVSRHAHKADVVFVIDHTERDSEGDVRYWNLVPADRIDRGFTVRVYND
jgi:hypothetical protein